jgi:glycosyltransferase involved in cell wall biosynthesis
VVVYPPVDVDRFAPVPEKEVGDYYLFVSRLVGYKKCDLVIESFNDLKLPLKIIGQGPEKKNLQKMANDNIEFLGFLSDAEIKEYYSKARAFVFAAEEDFGIVAVEAMASGRPVIAFGRGGATETVVDGKTGVLFPEQTPQCLIDAVKNFKPENYKSSEIRQHALAFSAERFRKEFKAEIDRIIQNHKI